MNLTSAELYPNTLTGTVPASWSGLKHLQLVNLGENYLTGSLFSFPRNLTKYSIRCNKFSGLLPALNWSQLQVFEVGGPNNINPGPTKCEKHYQVNNWTCPLPAIPSNVHSILRNRSWNSVHWLLPGLLWHLQKLQGSLFANMFPFRYFTFCESISFAERL